MLKFLAVVIVLSASGFLTHCYGDDRVDMHEAYDKALGAYKGVYNVINIFFVDYMGNITKINEKFYVKLRHVQRLHHSFEFSMSVYDTAALFLEAEHTCPIEAKKNEMKRELDADMAQVKNLYYNSAQDPQVITVEIYNRIQDMNDIGNESSALDMLRSDLEKVIYAYCVAIGRLIEVEAAITGKEPAPASDDPLCATFSSSTSSISTSTGKTRPTTPHTSITGETRPTTSHITATSHITTNTTITGQTNPATSHITTTGGTRPTTSHTTTEPTTTSDGSTEKPSTKLQKLIKTLEDEMRTKLDNFVKEVIEIKTSILGSVVYAMVDVDKIVYKELYDLGTANLTALIGIEFNQNKSAQKQVDCVLHATEVAQDLLEPVVLAQVCDVEDLVIQSHKIIEIIGKDDDWEKSLDAIILSADNCVLDGSCDELVNKFPVVRHLILKEVDAFIVNSFNVLNEKKMSTQSCVHRYQANVTKTLSEIDKYLNQCYI